VTGNTIQNSVNLPGEGSQAMEIEGNLEEDEEDGHDLSSCRDWSSPSVAGVGEDRAGEVNAILESPALAVKLLDCKC